VRRSRSTTTIADVAAQARVGASTVSRVLNGGRVSSPARARVLAALEESGRRAVQRLIAAMHDEEAPHEERLELKLKLRRTTAAPR
jgi:DNA-binding LacI/PurR family transcriptional regulator